MTTVKDRAQGVKPNTWTLIYSSLSVHVWESQNYENTYWVEPTNGPSMTFKGETAWEDAERYAGDYESGAWGCVELKEMG